MMKRFKFYDDRLEVVYFFRIKPFFKTDRIIIPYEKIEKFTVITVPRFGPEIHIKVNGVKKSIEYVFPYPLWGLVRLRYLFSLLKRMGVPINYDRCDDDIKDKLYTPLTPKEEEYISKIRSN